MTTGRAVVNRLPKSAQKLDQLNASGSWSSDNADFTIENSEFCPYDTTHKQIVFTGETEMTISSVVLRPDDDGTNIEFAFAVKMVSGGSVEVVVQDTSTAGTTEQTTTFEINPQLESPDETALNDLAWQVFRTAPTILDRGNLPAPRVDITITFTPTDDSDLVYFSIPVLSGTLDVGRFSESARQMVMHIPNFFLDETDEDSNPPGAMLRFLDVAFSGLDDAIKAFRDYRFYTIAEGRKDSLPETLSNLVWPSDAGLDEAKWLTQFTGTEPVAKLSSTLDPSDPFVLDTSVLNGTDTLRFSTTGVNDPPLGTVEVTRDFLRWQAEYGYYGMNAGSLAAVRESVKRVMVEPREVTIDLQHDGPFTVLVQTPWEQTYGASEDDVGEASPVVLEAIERARPIGVKITHELT